MKIGIFDSGVGGLIITHAVIQELPHYDYLFLGDTARVPYGNRSSETVYQFTRQAVEYLFQQDCMLVILACNTASAEALRRLQQEYLPQHYPGRKVLGVLIPAVEAAVEETRNNHIGVIATTATVESRAYVAEIRKRRPDVAVFQQATPLLVPLIESDGLQWAKPILREYLRPLRKDKIDTLVLGCTHYPAAREQIQQAIGEGVNLIGQDQIIPQQVITYLEHHPEVARRLTQNGQRQFELTDLTASSQKLADRLFGNPVAFTHISLTSP